MININKWIQTNRGNLLGTLWATLNIDLTSNLGAVRVAPKMRLNVSTATEANLGFPVAFAYFDTMMWALAGDRIFKNGASNIISAFTADTSTNFVTTYDKNNADMLVFNNELVATADTKIWSKAANGGGTGSWTERGSTALTTTTNHKLCYLKKTNRLYVTNNGTDIKSLDTSWTVASSGDYFLDLQDDIGRIVTMVATSDRLFIGTLRPTNTTPSAIESASVLEWDGVSNQITVDNKINAQGVLAMTVLNNVVYLMDTNGILRQYNGGGFTEVGRLPIDKEMLTLAVSTFNERFIHPNGLIATKNGTILAFINNLISDNAGSIKENFPAGIWEWSRENGFVHKHSLTYQTATGTTLTDNGQQRILKAGALANANVFSTSASGRGTLICGANYYTDASTSTFGIFVDSPIPTDNATTPEGKKYGYLVTQWIRSNQVSEAWQKLYTKNRQLLNSTDKIVAKYRKREADPIYIDITWETTTRFSTATDISAYTGYEVEILQGTGSGKCAHISTISGNNPWKANLDETFTGVTTGTAKARLQKWTKIGTIQNQDTEVNGLKIGDNSYCIQLKVCMEFTGDNEIYGLDIINKTTQFEV